jgi:alkaline phosphatase D
MRNLFLLALVLLPLLLKSQTQDLLLAGPMLGYNEHREQLIWLEVSPVVKEVNIRYWEKSKPDKTYEKHYSGKLGQDYNPVKITLTNLDMDTEYEFDIYLDGKKQDRIYNQSFKTRLLWQWRMPAPGFSFLFGSCVYINDSISDRPGKPYGQSTGILKSMLAQPSDFMLWGGDNIYFREMDWETRTGIYYRYAYSRKNPELRALLASRPNYAIWDDHDYGPNDSDKGYKMKQVTLQAFKDHWGNNTYGERKNPGIYTNFNWSDAEFFMLDDRYYRSNNKTKDSINGKVNKSKAYFGHKQIEWLKNNLLASRATFKFIVNGNQMLNVNSQHESFAHFNKEYQELIDFIKTYQIEGVVFLTGDRHFSEIIKLHPGEFYPLYDITSSSITARTYTNILETPEGDNPLRVGNYITSENNFMLISVTGPRKSRVLTVQCFNRENKLLWTFSIDENELRIKR